MAYRQNVCAMLSLDQAAQTSLQQLQDRLAEQLGTSLSLPPNFSAHITLANYPTVDLDELLCWSRKFLAKRQRFSVSYAGLDLLGHCLVLYPAEQSLLRQWYQDFHQELDEYCDQWTKASAGLWQAHSSLYCALSPAMAAALGDCRPCFTPFTAGLDRFELSALTAQGYEIIFSQELGSAP